MSGASSERKMSSSRTMMKRNERPSVWLPVLFELCLVGDVRRDRPGEVQLQRAGRADLENVACRSSTTVFWVADVGLIDMHLDEQLGGSTVMGDGELLGRAARVGPGVAARTSRASAAWSAAVSGPWSSSPTMMIWLSVFALPRIGVASVAASELGALAGRNWLLSLFTSLPSEGSAFAETTISTIHSTTTSTRNRTTNRPRPEKKRFTDGDLFLVGGTVA